MRYLITGAGGQLGLEWADFFNENGISFHAYSSKDLDITNKLQVKREIQKTKSDVLINCAAYTKVDLAETESELAYKVNAEGAKILAEVCKDLGVKLIHYSTDYVFSGSLEDLKEHKDGFSEDFDTNPINVYGDSKLKGETEIQEVGGDFLILRVSWLCGKHGNNFVKTMLRLGREKSELSIVNDQFGSPTFARNVVQNTFALINEKQVGIFNISSTGLCTWFDFASEIFSQSNIKINLNPVSSEEFKTKAKRPSFSKLDTKKLSSISGSSFITWQAGLKQLLSELQNEDY